MASWRLGSTPSDEAKLTPGWRELGGPGQFQFQCVMKSFASEKSPGLGPKGNRGGGGGEDLRGT